MYLPSFLHLQGGDSNLSRRFWSMNNKRAGEVWYFVGNYINRTVKTVAVKNIYVFMKISLSLQYPDCTPVSRNVSQSQSRPDARNCFSHTHTHKIRGVGFLEYSSKFLINPFKINYFHIHIQGGW